VDQINYYIIILQVGSSLFRMPGGYGNVYDEPTYISLITNSLLPRVLRGLGSETTL